MLVWARCVLALGRVLQMTACASDLCAQHRDISTLPRRLKFNRADSGFASKRSVHGAGQTIWTAIKGDDSLEGPFPIGSQRHKLATIEYPNSFAAP